MILSDDNSNTMFIEMMRDNDLKQVSLADNKIRRHYLYTINNNNNDKQKKSNVILLKLMPSYIALCEDVWMCDYAS